MRKSKSHWIGAIIICLGLFSMNFLNMGWYICFLASLLVLLYMIRTNSKLKITKLFFFVVALSFCNYIIIVTHSGADIIAKTFKYLLSPILGYLLGMFLSQRLPQKSITHLYKLVLIPYFFNGFLNMVIFRGYEIEWQRELADFWTGELWKATLVGTYFSPVIVLSFWAFADKKASFASKIINLFMGIFSFVSLAIIGTRTGILVGIITIVLSVLLYIKAANGTGKAMRIFSIFALFFGAMGAALYFNVGNIQQSTIIQRFLESDLASESRIELFMNVINNCMNYPFGGMPYFYSHNTWLDFLRISGWIPFVLFVCITIISIRHIVRIAKNKRLSLMDRIFPFSVMVAFFLEMFVEPIMDGAAIMYCLFYYLIAVNENRSRMKKESTVR